MKSSTTNKISSLDRTFFLSFPPWSSSELEKLLYQFSAQQEGVKNLPLLQQCYGCLSTFVISLGGILKTLQNDVCHWTTQTILSCLVSIQNPHGSSCLAGTFLLWDLFQKLYGVSIIQVLNFYVLNHTISLIIQTKCGEEREVRLQILSLSLWQQTINYGISTLKWPVSYPPAVIFSREARGVKYTSEYWIPRKS